MSCNRHNAPLIWPTAIATAAAVALCGLHPIATGGENVRSSEPLSSRHSVTQAGSAPATVSYYGKGDGFHGRKTASGARFDANQLTAAHRTLRFGTRVKLSNPNNGRAVTVEINDRGPYIRGRSYDLSYRAAQLLGVTKQGVARVNAQIISR